MKRLSILLWVMAGCAASIPAAQSHLGLLAVVDTDLALTRPALVDSLEHQEDPAGAAVAEQKPVGTMHVLVWKSGCAACDKFKRDSKDYKGLVFKYRETQDEAPVFYWKVGDTWYRQVGYTTLPALISNYNASLKK